MSDQEHDRVLGELAAELAAIKNELADVRVRYDALHKRQIIPLDDRMLAIRHTIGWLVVPSEDFASVLHLADGVSGHENGTLKVMQTLVRTGDTVIDLGAHIGLHSLPLARAVGRNGRLIAVEPLPRTAECLRRSLLCNDLLQQTNILVAAASDEEGTATFYLGANSMLGSLYPAVDDQRAIEVREIRVDAAVGTETRIDFVKMDVEGAELRALAGMHELIARNPDIGLIAEFGASHLERIGINPQDWFDAFAAAGLAHAYIINEVDGSLSLLDVERITRMFSANVLFVRHPQRITGLTIAPLPAETP